jgi:hypothetical protein
MKAIAARFLYTCEDGTISGHKMGSDTSDSDIDIAQDSDAKAGDSEVKELSDSDIKKVRFEVLASNDIRSFRRHVEFAISSGAFGDICVRTLPFVFIIQNV